MKTVHYKLMAAWLLLFCFIAGQFVAYAHKHQPQKYSAQHHSDSKAQDFTEKCKLCDVLHHTDMDVQHNNFAFNLHEVLFTHPQVEFNFTSFALILSDGLSPPRCFKNA